MRHGVLNGGKRLRPFLVMESAALFDVDAGAALRVAAALECVHCYSLIHDDLPAMDDDDLRRGQPTVHKAFDEATAILAGDSLLTLAFDILADEATALAADRRAALVLALARAAGAGRHGRRTGARPRSRALPAGRGRHHHAAGDEDRRAHPLRLRGRRDLAGGASAADRERLAEFGSAIGLAFQLADDLLDLTADSQAMGKATGKDQAAGKATLVAIHGVDWAKRQLGGLVAQAQELLGVYGERSAMLQSAASFVASRRN